MMKSMILKLSRLPKFPRLPKSIAVALLLSAAAPLLLHGCSGKSVEDGDPAQLYKDAEDEIKTDHYQLAIDRLRIIKNKYPYSKYATDAQLRIADVYYLQESYGEAALAYESFRDLHPKHEKVAYAMFRIGKSYFNDAPSNIARDLTPAQKALDAYNDFLKKFPAAPEASEARTDVASIRKTLANKELYIANFYYKRGEYDSANGRYQKIMTLYPDSDAAVEAKSKLDWIASHFMKSSASK